MSGTSTDLWERVLAIKTFNSTKGRALQSEARPKLKILPAALDPTLAERVFQLYVDDAPYDLWPVARKLAVELIPAFIAVVAKSGSLEAKLLLEAHARGGANGFHEMGELIAFAASGTNVPALLKRAEKARPAFDTPTTRAAGEAILQQLQVETAHQAILLHGMLMWLLMQEGDAKLIAKMKASATDWDARDIRLGHDPNSNMDLLMRVAKAAGVRL